MKIFNLLACIVIFCNSCISTQKPTIKDIYPISPYQSFTKLEDENGKIEARAKVEYFVIYGNVSDTAYMRNLLLVFIKDRFKNIDINPPNNYEIRFYKKSNKTNKEFKESNSDSIDYHLQDEFATITYQKNGDHWLTFQH